MSCWVSEFCVCLARGAVGGSIFSFTPWLALVEEALCREGRGPTDRPSSRARSLVASCWVAWGGAAAEVFYVLVPVTLCCLCLPRYAAEFMGSECPCDVCPPGSLLTE